MRRIGRYILNTLTVLSLVLCVATVGLWVRTYASPLELRYVQRWQFDPSGDHTAGTRGVLSVSAYRGRWMLVVVDSQWTQNTWRPYPLPNDLDAGFSFRHPRVEGTWAVGFSSFSSRLPFGNWVRPYPRGSVPSFWNRIGFGRAEYPWGLGGSFCDPLRCYSLPQWLPVFASVCLPSLWLTRLMRRKRRARAGACLKCGYDLRATPDRCPECGAIPTKVKA